MTISEQIFAYKELKKNGQAFFVDTYEDADRIIESLEKQIPKKPTLTQRRLYTSYVCECGHDFGNTIMKLQPDYCPNCGQHICWEGEEECRIV